MSDDDVWAEEIEEVPVANRFTPGREPTRYEVGQTLAQAARVWSGLTGRHTIPVYADRGTGDGGDPDEQHLWFSAGLFVALNQQSTLSVSDGVTAHTVVPLGLVREGDDQRVLYQDPSMDGSFLAEGRNAAGVRARQYVGGYREGVSSGPTQFCGATAVMLATGAYGDNVWSVTLGELARVFRGDCLLQFMNPPGSVPDDAGAGVAAVLMGHLHGLEALPDGLVLRPFEKPELRRWYLRHEERPDGLLAYAHGPGGSFQITLDVGFVTASRARDGVRWDVGRESGGYSVWAAIGRVRETAGRPDRDALVAFLQRYTDKLTADGVGPPGPPSGAELGWLPSARPFLVVTYPDHPDIDPWDPQRPMVAAVGGRAEGMGDWIAVGPLGWSPGLAHIVCLHDSRAFLLTVRGYGKGWSQGRLRALAARLAHSVLPLSD
ncbi:MAG: hypothetical protein K2X82_07005 [Gemmataceae bacterium]|nr:hypothetical protein [Gemmataceae bacterium]